MRAGALEGVLACGEVDVSSVVAGIEEVDIL